VKDSITSSDPFLGWVILDKSVLTGNIGFDFWEGRKIPFETKETNSSI